MSVPRGRWKAATFIAGRSARSVIAPRSVQIPARSGCRLAGM
jgi:hypothetical protein